MALYRCSSPSGGGGSSCASGTTNAAAANAAITINTGLSEIHQFVWFATATNNAYQNILTYDENMGSYYTAAAVPQGSVFKRAIGQVAQNAAPAINSINGGTIVINTATGYGAVGAGYWFAC